MINFFAEFSKIFCKISHIPSFSFTATRDSKSEIFQENKPFFFANYLELFDQIALPSFDSTMTVTNSMEKVGVKFFLLKPRPNNRTKFLTFQRCSCNMDSKVFLQYRRCWIKGGVQGVHALGTIAKRDI